MTTQNEKYQPLMEDNVQQAQATAHTGRPSNPSKYDPFQVPPDFREAEGHHMATRIAVPMQNAPPLIDDASGLPMNNKVLPLCSNPNNLSFIAPGYPLYFQFRRFCLVIGFTILLCSGVHNIVDYYKGTACKDDTLQFNRTSQAHREDQTYQTYQGDQPSQVYGDQTYQTYQGDQPGQAQGDQTYQTQSTDQSYYNEPVDHTYDQTGVSQFLAGTSSGMNYVKNEFGFLKVSGYNETRAKGHMDQCQKNFVNQMSVANRLNDRNSLEKADIYNFFTICMILLLMQILRKIQKQTAQVCDERAITSSDYTIRVTNIPRDFAQDQDIDEEIRNFFIHNGVPGTKLNVQNVSVCYIADEKVDVVKKLKERATARSKLLARKKKGELVSDDEIDRLENEMDALKQMKVTISQRYGRGVGVARFFAGEAYVTFETQQELQEVLRTWRLSKHELFLESLNSKSTYKFRGNIINVTQAPEPSDVFWENAGTSYVKKFALKLITNIVTAIMLAGGFYVIFAIQKKKFGMLNEIKSSIDEHKFVVTVQVQVISILASVFIVVVNTILRSVLLFFTKREKFSTYTEFQATYAMRLALAQFFNTALVTFFIYIFFENIAGPGGLIYTAFLIFVSDAVMTWMFTILSPTYLMYRFKKWKTSKTASPIMTQEELNEVYKYPAFDFPTKYATMAKTLLSAAFFAPLVPPVIVVALVTLIVDYWLDKYVMLRRCSRGKGTGPELAFDFIEFLEYCLVFFAIGNFVFNIYILGSDLLDEKLTIIGLAIGVANAFLPMDKINEKIFPGRDEILTNDKYSQLKFTFQEDYDRSNPATEEIALAHFLEEKNKHSLA